ncbi:uncharacterized protein LOC111945216, partial [Cyanistes caeruleus]|uniref:uncharacterized protein LOC111945216 n=1 Tax=Cyanistes caeruleus TaxID=156563 RepID=UPI000CDA34F1
LAGLGSHLAAGEPRGSPSSSSTVGDVTTQVRPRRGLTWSQGAAVWGSHLEFRCCSSGSTPGVQVWQFGVHTWSSGVAVRALQFGVHTWSSGVTVRLLQFGVHTWLRCHHPGVAAAAFWGQNHNFGLHTWPGSQVLAPFTWGSGVAVQVSQLLFLGVKTTILGSSTPVLAHRYRILPSPGAQVLQSRCHCCRFLGSKPQFWGAPHPSWLTGAGSPHLRGSGVAVHAPVLQQVGRVREPLGAHPALVGRLPRVHLLVHRQVRQVLEELVAHRYRILHLGLRCCGPGVTDAVFGGQNHNFGELHTRPGSQVLNPSTWGSAVAVQVSQLPFFGVKTTILRGSTPVLAHRCWLPSPQGL